MRMTSWTPGIWAIVALAVVPATAQTFPAKLLPQEKIEEVLAQKGTFNERGSVLKLQWAREDVKSSVVRNRVSFQVGKRKPAIMTGEMPLLPNEVNPMLAALVQSDVSVTALHCVSLEDEPRVFLLHFDAEGDPVLMAAAVRKGIEAVKIAGARAKPGPVADSALSASALDAVFGTSGKSIRGMYELEIPHAVEMPCGCMVGADMGVRTSLVFRGTDNRARVEGDIACVAGQLQRTLKALVESKIEVTSISNHLELEAPRTIYVHISGIGKAPELAKAIKPALISSPPQPAADVEHEHHEH